MLQSGRVCATCHGVRVFCNHSSGASRPDAKAPRRSCSFFASDTAVPTSSMAASVCGCHGVITCQISIIKGITLTHTPAHTLCWIFCASALPLTVYLVRLKRVEELRSIVVLAQQLFGVLVLSGESSESNRSVVCCVLLLP